MKKGDKYKIHYELNAINVEIKGIRPTFLGDMIYFEYVNYSSKKTGYLYKWFFKYKIIN